MVTFITDKELNKFKLDMQKAILQEKIDLLRSLPITHHEFYPGHYSHTAQESDIIKKCDEFQAELNKLNDQ